MPKLFLNVQDKKRLSVLQEQHRRMQEAMTSKPAPPSEDYHFERSAVKIMGAMEEGDAVFGSNSEVNLDSQVLNLKNISDLCLEKFHVAHLFSILQVPFVRFNTVAGLLVA